MRITEDQRAFIKLGIVDMSKLLMVLKDIECEARADFDAKPDGRTPHEYAFISRLTDSINLNTEHLRRLLTENQRQERE